jgi:hypothetical protein
MRGTEEHIGDVTHAGLSSRMRDKRSSRPCAGGDSPHLSAGNRSVIDVAAHGGSML